MKVRFSSQKEHDPTREGGLKVLYAPGKRAAFRLRWYLILLLVASPFLWFVSKLVMEIALVEAPARILQPTLEIRALEGGQVVQLHVKPGQDVEAGSSLVTLNNPGLMAEKIQLEAALGLARPTAGQLAQRQQSGIQSQIDRATTRVQELEQLLANGAATRGELAAARDQLDNRKNELTAFLRSLEPPQSLAGETARERQQLLMLEQRLTQLRLRAPESGYIRDIEVVEGENTGPGNLLMRLVRDQPPEIHVFLSAHRIELAREGQQLQLPDGQWLEAKVSDVPRGVQRLPPDLRSPFGTNELGLLVKVDTLKPLPRQWRIDNVPVTARFPNVIQRWLEARN